MLQTAKLVGSRFLVHLSTLTIHEHDKGSEAAPGSQVPRRQIDFPNSYSHFSRVSMRTVMLMRSPVVALKAFVSVL